LLAPLPTAAREPEDADGWSVSPDRRAGLTLDDEDDAPLTLLLPWRLPLLLPLLLLLLLLPMLNRGDGLEPTVLANDEVDGIRGRIGVDVKLNDGGGVVVDNELLTGWKYGWKGGGGWDGGGCGAEAIEWAKLMDGSNAG